MTPAVTHVTTPRRRNAAAWPTLAALAVFLVIVVALRLCIGPEALAWPGSAIVWELRWSRIVVALIAGAALAASGVALQSLLRNPLAEPFLLGISTGAGVGMMFQLAVTYWVTQRVFGPTWLGALVGASASAALVYAMGRRFGALDPLRLLLIGVVLSTINGGLIMLFNYIAGPGQLRADLASFMMGYLNESSSATLRGVIAAITAGLCGWLWWAGRAMDLASVSDDEAVTLGVHLSRLRAGLFLSASTLAACAVVLAGPLAFVGLIAPHLGRLLIGPTHRPVLLGSLLIGAALLVGADAVSALLNMALGIGMVPIGVFTAMLGGVMFLGLLLKDEPWG